MRGNTTGLAMVIAVAAALFVAGCGDQRPLWRQANLPQSMIPLMPPGAHPADVATLAERSRRPPSAAQGRSRVEVAGPPDAAVTLASSQHEAEPEIATPGNVGKLPRQLAAADTAHFVQIGAYRSQAGSEQQWRELVARYPRVLGQASHNIVRRDFGPPKGVYFQIHLGPFPDRVAAEARCASLKAVGIDCFVLRARIEDGIAPAAGSPPPATTPGSSAAAPARASKKGQGQGAGDAARPTGTLRAAPPPAPKGDPDFIRSTLGIDDDG